MKAMNAPSMLISKMSSKDESEDTPTTVKTIGNEMFFYGEITQESILEFTECFKKLEIDVDNKTATIGVGVTAYELQKEAYKHGMRALVAEAEAHVCVNIASVGIISTWGNTYGWGSDNFTDATIVDSKGNIVHHSDEDLTNPYSTNNNFTNLTLTPSKIITEATVKLHPIFKDEEAVLVPFEKLDDALDLALELAKRKIGLSLAIISSKYLSEFICPTNEIAEDFDYIAQNYLKLNYIVDMSFLNFTLCKSKQSN